MTYRRSHHCWSIPFYWNPNRLSVAGVSGCFPLDKGERIKDRASLSLELEKQGSLKVIQEDTLRSSCTNDIKGKPSKHARLLLGFGVSIQWLLAFTYAHNCWKYPTWKIVKDIIKPATKSQAWDYVLFSFAFF